MKKRLARILLVFALVLAAFSANGCATKSQSGDKVHRPNKSASRPATDDGVPEPLPPEDPPPPPPPPTY